MGKWLGIRRLREDDFLDFFDPQQNQISYQFINSYQFFKSISICPATAPNKPYRC
jgi:hypothetical protein